MDRIASKQRKEASRIPASDQDRCIVGPTDVRHQSIDETGRSDLHPCRERCDGGSPECARRRRRRFEKGQPIGAPVQRLVTHSDPGRDRATEESSTIDQIDRDRGPCIDHDECPIAWQGLGVEQAILPDRLWWVTAILDGDLEVARCDEDAMRTRERFDRASARRGIHFGDRDSCHGNFANQRAKVRFETRTFITDVEERSLDRGLGRHLEVEECDRRRGIADVDDQRLRQRATRNDFVMRSPRRSISTSYCFRVAFALK